MQLEFRLAAVAEWYRYRIVACLVTSSSPVPLKTRRVGQRCTLNLSRAETSSRWCDYLVIGSDSGKIVILEYNAQKNVFEKVHQETFGKSGCRRIVPGQYLAIDPKGRAVMIGAVEKKKLVYILNRDTAARLTISSPLEAPKSNTLVYHMVGVDAGFENPLFACLEMNYEVIFQTDELPYTWK
ncbi:splicing factor 3B subunit 3 [Trichonephila clavipes]|uniref:Splicing factor 3B subunit 3 n=1 Tax=Trichonephila clavipes TaxID=2585209 RepID=A0A8X6RF71_TRICX|nr:splicing factor 3B subunit 3 [Trichonephila clavipes]